MLQLHNRQEPEPVGEEGAAVAVEPWVHVERRWSQFLLEGWICPCTYADSGRLQPTTPSSSGAASTANSSTLRFVRVSLFNKAICLPKSTNARSRSNSPRPKDNWLVTRRCFSRQKRNSNAISYCWTKDSYPGSSSISRPPRSRNTKAPFK